jgi:hypothetical protein
LTWVNVIRRPAPILAIEQNAEVSMADEHERQAQPAEFYRWRAKEYRRMADEATDLNLASLYRRLAVAFDKEADKVNRT